MSMCMGLIIALAYAQGRDRDGLRAWGSAKFAVSVSQQQGEEANKIDFMSLPSFRFIHIHVHIRAHKEKPHKKIQHLQLRPLLPFVSFPHRMR